MQKLIDEYEAGAATVKNAIAGLTREQLMAHPVVGTWSIQQIVVHLADCEQVFADRIKRIIAEDKPTLIGFDENRWMSLAVASRNAEETAGLLELVRRQIVTILREVGPDAFKRVGVHSEMGDMSLAQIVEKANWHLNHHMKFLNEKRGMVLGQREAVGNHR